MKEIVEKGVQVLENDNVSPPSFPTTKLLI
jgi:hypothetical protein